MPDEDRQARRVIYIAQVLLVLAAGALWGGSRLPWVVIRSFDGLGPPKTTSVSGATWSTALVPLALLALAAAVAAIAVRGWMLRVLAVLLAVASLTAGYLAISLWETGQLALRGAELAQVPIAALQATEPRLAGALFTLVAAVAILLAAALLMRAAARVGPTTKYIAPAGRRSRARGEATDTLSERALWDALDEGHDPTAATDPHDDGTNCGSDTEGR